MDERDEWRVRPAITAAIGLAAAVIVQLLVDRDYSRGVPPPAEAWRTALAMATAVGGILAIFTVERVRMQWAVAFAVATAIVAGLVTWSNGPGDVAGDWLWDWRTACLFLSIAIAAPLFQVARDTGRARFDYAEVHGHAWTNVVLWCAGCAFTGIAFALAYLLSELFQLVGIHVLRDLLRHGWANAMLAGAAFGGAVGLLRERDTVVRTLQRVVTAILGVLAPVLGVGLVLFLIALPFTGLDALWDATRATTPILLSCVIGALILANAVIGDGEDTGATSPPLRWSAMALGATMLPLALIAAIATGLRIGQYGFTPDRLWALTFVAVACAYSLAYFVALVRRRQRWAEAVRPANLTLAFGLMGVTMLLATQLVSFNTLSTRDQIARLTSGRVSPTTFDWRALAFDFGAPGRTALRRLAASSDPTLATLAREAASKTHRWEVADTAGDAERRAALARRLRVIPAGTPLPAGIAALLPDWQVCGDGATTGCVLIHRAGSDEAVAVAGTCVAPPDPAERHGGSCAVRRLGRSGGVWRVEPERSPILDNPTIAALRSAAAAGAVEVRRVERRQVFIGGRPVGDPFE